MPVKFIAPQMVFIRDLLDPQYNALDDNYMTLLKRTVDEMRSNDPKVERYQMQIQVGNQMMVVIPIQHL